MFCSKLHWEKKTNTENPEFQSTKVQQPGISDYPASSGLWWLNCRAKKKKNPLRMLKETLQLKQIPLFLLVKSDQWFWNYVGSWAPKPEILYKDGIDVLTFKAGCLCCSVSTRAEDAFPDPLRALCAAPSAAACLSAHFRCNPAWIKPFQSVSIFLPLWIICYEGLFMLSCEFWVRSHLSKCPLAIRGSLSGLGWEGP